MSLHNYLEPILCVCVCARARVCDLSFIHFWDYLHNDGLFSNCKLLSYKSLQNDYRHVQKEIRAIKKDITFIPIQGVS